MLASLLVSRSFLVSLIPSSVMLAPSSRYLPAEPNPAMLAASKPCRPRSLAVSLRFSDSLADILEAVVWNDLRSMVGGCSSGGTGPQSEREGEGERVCMYPSSLGLGYPLYLCFPLVKAWCVAVSMRWICDGRCDGWKEVKGSRYDMI